jgi:hypothetical protein
VGNSSSQKEETTQAPDEATGATLEAICADALDAPTEMGVLFNLLSDGPVAREWVSAHARPVFFVDGDFTG